MLISKSLKGPSCSREAPVEFHSWQSTMDSLNTAIGSRGPQCILPPLPEQRHLLNHIAISTMPRADIDTEHRPLPTAKATFSMNTAPA